MNRSLGKKIENVEAMCEFVLAGKAWFAIKSLKTGTVFQYKVTAAKSKINAPKAWWVKVLDEATENMSSPYRYIGGLYIFQTNIPSFSQDKGIEVITNKNHPAFTILNHKINTFKWFWERMCINALPPSLEFYHIGRCARCGHKLTDEQSIDRGFGPTCYKMIKEQYKNI